MIQSNDQSLPASATAPALVPDLKTLKAAIPEHCFRPSLAKSLQYVFRDVILMTTLFYAATVLVHTQPSLLRTILLAAYGTFQGLVFTGIWILAHECGHDAFSSHRKFNAVLGFFLHSIVMVPFFSWKYSHARHHRYTNHMDKDTVFVPSRKGEYRNSFWAGELLGHAEDAPIVTIALFLAHQLLGWQLYIVLNATAGEKSLVESVRKESIRQSHLDPGADLFTSQERPYVLMSNIGLAMVVGALWYSSTQLGTYNVFLIYGIPYLWMNHWLVAITFLHHTHLEVPRYEDEAWTFQKGAMSTIDRDFGFVGRHIFHGIIEYHVIHHMFPRIPFYHAEEATEAVRPLMGKAYKQEKTSFLHDLWSTFNRCEFVEGRDEMPGHVFWSNGRSKA